MTMYSSPDAAFCARLTRRHARTFSVASRFLPPEKRRAAFAVYAFCRIADDIVDDAPATSRARAHDDLERHRQALVMALRGHPIGPLFRELAWAIHRFHIPAGPFHALVNTLTSDLAPTEIETWPALAAYCAGVASTVGEMCAHVFGLPADRIRRAQTLAHARTLGVALQLTNILRDVGEDAVRGRCYLPSSDLFGFGLSRDAVLSGRIDPRDERWHALMRHEIERARSLYTAAEPGVPMLDADAQCCATMCSRGYASILGAIERRGFDSIGGRARIGVVRKAYIFADVWRTTRFRGHRASYAAAPSSMRVRSDSAAQT